MRASMWNRLLRVGLGLALAATTVGTGVAAARPFGDRPSRPRALNLFASQGLLVEVNRVQCGLANFGEVCVAFAGSPVGGGGFWPKGTVDQYIFNSGLQLAGVVDPAAGFTWAGDTIGSFFFDPKGTQVHGDPITDIFSALSAQDAGAWPNGAVVRDTAIYNSVLINRNFVSQGDSWVRYWDGNPDNIGGRTHPMGILVEQRSLAWNFPSGNEDILYFVFTFYNVTASTASVYNNPTIYPAVQAEIAAIGALFQAENEQKFGIAIPDGGYTIRNLYAAFAMDADVAQFQENYTTAFLPFNIGTIYSGNWLPEVGWSFPPDIFGAPFAAAPGFVGVKYLKSPKVGGVEVGLTMFSQTYNPNNPVGLKDPDGVNQLYRYLSGYLGAGDVTCDPFTNPADARLRRLCYLGQTPGDARFYQSSGPLDLAPGESQSIVVAYVHAAPLGIVTPLIGGSTTPDVPFTGDSIFQDPTKVRLIDSIAGWVGFSGDSNGNAQVDQDEVIAVPRSLLHKSLVAQEVFDNKFLLPFSPDAPTFFLVGGDNEVTVLWQKSGSEVTGDPFFTVASDPTSALYNPNFNQFDVEGYRVYRGRTSADLELVAQFDYDGTFLIDYTGFFDYSGDHDGDGLSQCAPELGLQADCDVTFDVAPPYTSSIAHALVGNVIQIPPGGRVQLADGNVFVLKSDTAVTGGNSGFPPLNSAGVPFAFVDRSVRNGFTYFYAVTAFDVNAVASGPTSLESPRVTQPVIPRRGSGQETGASLTAPLLLDRAGNTLNPFAPLPAFNATTATWAGPMPPTNGFFAGIPAFTPAMVGGGTVTITIDSIIPGHAADGLFPGSSSTYFVSVAGPTGTTQVQLPLTLGGFSEPGSILVYAPAAKLDQTKAAPFGGDTNYAMFASVSLAGSGTWRTTSWGRGDINADPTRSWENGPRWWTGAANENTNRPNELVCAPSSGGCVQADLSRNAGAMAGVGIFHPSSYLTVNSGPMRSIEAIGVYVARAADFRVHWGAGGVVDSVIDVTHNVTVPFKTNMRASWGILNAASFAGTPATDTRDGNNALLTWSDIACVDPVPSLLAGVCNSTATPAVLQATAALNPIAFQSAVYNNTPTLTQTGGGTDVGFIFYLNGHFFMMHMQGGTLPTAGTVWNARFYTGRVRANSVTLGPPFTFLGTPRAPAVPGLRAQFTFQGSTFSPDSVTAASLASVHTVPDPYYVTNSLEFTQNNKVLKFVNVPMRAIIRIYSLSGVLVNVLIQDDPTGAGEVNWNLRNRNNQFVASGVYFYHVETPDGKSKVGRFTIVTFAP